MWKDYKSCDGGIVMKKSPEVEIREIKLLCPDCGAVLTNSRCDNCGCEIDTSEITVDIQPEEIIGY